MKFKISDIFIGFIFTLLFISIGAILSINFRGLYYFDVDFLNIPENTGVERNVIIENYDALIDYNSPFFQGDLEFPTLPASPEGLQHFVEVKNIFVALYYIAGITLILAVLIIFYKKRKRDYRYLLISSIMVIVIPTIVAIGCAINFDAAFVIFHKIFFRNNYWLFDPYTDPIINFLPDTFFLHCLIIILGFVFLGSFILFLFSKKLKRHYMFHSNKHKHYGYNI